MFSWFSSATSRLDATISYPLHLEPTCSRCILSLRTSGDMKVDWQSGQPFSSDMTLRVGRSSVTLLVVNITV